MWFTAHFSDNKKFRNYHLKLNLLSALFFSALIFFTHLFCQHMHLQIPYLTSNSNHFILIYFFLIFVCLFKSWPSVRMSCCENNMSEMKCSGNASFSTEAISLVFLNHTRSWCTNHKYRREINTNKLQAIEIFLSFTNTKNSSTAQDHF